MQCFLGCSSLLSYVLSAINGLITQRSVVQIHPPQPNLSFGFNGLSQSHNWLGDSKPNFPAQVSGFLYAHFYATPAGRRYQQVTLSLLSRPNVFDAARIQMPPQP